MRKPILPVVVLAFLISVLIFLQPTPLNKYQVAQKSTVLIESGHGYGTGFVVQRDDRLFVWTAAHVVAQDNVVKVRQVIHFEGHKVGETTFKAIVIARDDTTDLALLWLNAPPEYFQSARFPTLHPLHPTWNEPIKVGDPVFHVGNFFGPAFDGSVSTGVISQIGVSPEEIRDWPWPVVDQATLTVWPGSSGGPVFNSSGRVIGVIVGHVVPGVEFFVPLREIEKFAKTKHVEWAVNLHKSLPNDSALVKLALKSVWVRPPVNTLTPEPEGSTISGR